jgi:beta-glucanase (GH16 family)
MAVPCTVAPRHAPRRTFVWLLVLITVVAGSTGTAAAAPRPGTTTTAALATIATPLAATATGPVPTGVSGPFTMTFEDNFSGTTLDTSKWSTKEPWNTVGTGFVNDSDALLVSPPPAAHLAVSNDTVTLKARRTTAATNAGKAMQTTMLTSRDKYTTFTHGVVEARIKIPAGNGLWPQLWMQGNSAGGTWPSNGEVDIFEFVNNATSRGHLFGSVHWGADRSLHRQATKMAAAPYVGDGQFHTFTLHRTTSFLRFYVDGVQVFQMVPGEAVQNHSTIPASGIEKETLFDKPHHLRIGLEVGGSWAGQGLSWSQYQEGDLEVDYVRTWAPGAPVAIAPVPTVSAGADVAAHTAATALDRTAVENANGSTITARQWSIEAGSPAGVWTVIGTAAALRWTPTVPGTYTLRYQATNANGASRDDVTVVVTAATTTSTAVPTVSAGADVAAHTAATALDRTAVENANGSTITARQWSIEAGSPAGVWTVIGTAAALPLDPHRARHLHPPLPGHQRQRRQPRRRHRRRHPATTSRYTQQWSGGEGSPWPAELVRSTVGNAAGVASVRSGSRSDRRLGRLPGAARDPHPWRHRAELRRRGAGHRHRAAQLLGRAVHRLRAAAAAERRRLQARVPGDGPGAAPTDQRRGHPDRTPARGHSGRPTSGSASASTPATSSPPRCSPSAAPTRGGPCWPPTPRPSLRRRPRPTSASTTRPGGRRRATPASTTWS